MTRAFKRHTHVSMRNESQNTHSLLNSSHGSASTATWGSSARSSRERFRDMSHAGSDHSCLAFVVFDRHDVLRTKLPRPYCCLYPIAIVAANKTITACLRGNTARDKHRAGRPVREIAASVRVHRGAESCLRHAGPISGPIPTEIERYATRAFPPVRPGRPRR